MKHENTQPRGGWTRREFLANTGKGAIGLAVGTSGLLAARRAGAAEGSRFHPAVISDAGVVSCISRQAADAGISILDAGGNAMDAAIAMVFAIGVTRPDMGGIGGGGFLLCRTAAGEAAVLDFRETAPAAMNNHSFDEPGMHRETTVFLGGDPAGHRAAGVPGVVAGMAAALTRYGSGRFTLADLIAPAEALARNGIIVSDELALYVFFEEERLHYFPETEKSYGGLGPAYLARVPFIQPDYARSLQRIMESGAGAFYQPGAIADAIVADMAAAECRARSNPVLLAKGAANTALNRADGGSRWEEANDLGLMTHADLAAYQPVWREPLAGSYRGHSILTVPPPSAGGVVILEVLNLLEGYALGSNSLDPALALNARTSWAHSSANHLHVLAEAEKLSWADRTRYIADPDYVRVSAGQLISKGYAQKRRQEISLDLAGSYGPDPAPPRGGHTNHLCVMDRAGNCVSVTTSMNMPFGSVVVPPGLGFLLNNQLGDFTWDAPGDINQPEGGKRPRSSAAPTMVFRNGAPLLVLGGAGGTQIPGGIMQTILNTLDFGMDLAHAVDAERADAVAQAGVLRIEVPPDDPVLGTPAPNPRIARAVQDDLADRRKHVLLRATQQFAEYDAVPVINVVGRDPLTGRNQAVSDPHRGYTGTPLNEEYDLGAAGQGTSDRA